MRLLPLRVLFAWTLSALVPSEPARALERVANENAIKAVFLFKFGDYVEWPSTGAAITICIVGDDPFGSALDKAVEGQTIHALPIIVRRVSEVPHDAPCQILYVTDPDPNRASAIVSALRGANVLTVSDAAANGIVRFVIQDNKVRFEINEQAAFDNGLVISSKLLKLALSVKPRS